MKSFISTSWIFLLMALVACESDDPNHQTQQKMHEDVMVIHDEVMPKMGEINKLRKQLVKFSKTNEGLDEAVLSNIEKAVTYLETADEGMMDWMANYRKPSKLRGDQSHEEIMTYLQGEKVKVEQVKKDMLGSIDGAKKLLESVTGQTN